nr:T9SS type A sorting domain-containing protein [Terrimonas ginsenosidimutans]
MIQSGRFVSSRILKARTGFSDAGFSVYPNPVTDDRFNITLAAVQKGTYKLHLINGAGICVQTTSVHLQGDGITQAVSFPAGLNAGTYIISLKGDHYAASSLVVKK